MTTSRYLRRVLKLYFQDAATKLTAEEDKLFFESSRTDSGFLSSPNLVSDTLSSGDIKGTDSGVIDEDLTCATGPRSSAAPAKDHEDQRQLQDQHMRLDSGVDLGLSESFTGLSLKSSDGSKLNDLSSKKARKNEPPATQNVAPTITTTTTDTSPPWEIYFQQDDDGDTQLHIAVIHGFVEVVYSLIRIAPHPFFLDIVNDHAQSALHLAILTKQTRIARRLLCAGARPSGRDCRGHSPLHLACLEGDLDNVKALTAPVTIQEVETLGLKYAAVPRHEIDLEQRNYDGERCVHLAARRGHVEVLRHLVWLGADINAREGKSGYTPLHIAILRQDQALLQFLLTECKLLDPETPSYGGVSAPELARGSVFEQFLRSRGIYVSDSSDSEYDSDTEEDIPFETTFKQGLAIMA